MASSKRKRNNEALLREAEVTAFQAALAVLNDEKVKQGAERANKKQRVINSKDTVPVNVPTALLKYRPGIDGRVSNNCNDMLQHTAKDRWSKPDGAAIVNDDDKSHSHHKTTSNNNDTHCTTSATRQRAAQVIVRIQLLVAQQNRPIELRELPLLYHQTFTEFIGAKSLGFHTLQQFVESIPLVNVESYENDIVLLSMSPSIYRRSRSRRQQQQQQQQAATHTRTHSAVDERPSSVPTNAPFQVGFNKENVPTLVTERIRENVVGKSCGGGANLQSNAELQLAGCSSSVACNDSTNNAKVADPPLFVLDYTGASEQEAVSESLRVRSGGGTNQDDTASLATAIQCKQESQQQRQVTVDEVKRRIEMLVSRHAPVDLHSLPCLYEDRFHESLDPKSTGDGDLWTFVETMKSIQKDYSAKGILLSMSRPYRGASQEPSPVKQEGSDEPLLTNDEDHVGGNKDFRGTASNRAITNAKAAIKQESDDRTTIDETQETTHQTLPSARASKPLNVKERVAALVSLLEPVPLSSLPALYKWPYGECIEWKSSGKKKFKQLLRSIDSVEVKSVREGKADKWVLCAVSPNQQQQRHQGQAKMPLQLQEPSGINRRDTAQDYQPLPDAVSSTGDPLQILVGNGGRASHKATDSDYSYYGPDDMCSNKEPSHEPVASRMSIDGSKADEAISEAVAATEPLFVLDRVGTSTEDTDTESPLEIAKSRIRAILSDHARFDMGELPKTFQKRYGEPLDYKALGFSRLKGLVAKAIEGTGVEFKQSTGTLILQPLAALEGIHTRKTQGKDQIAKIKDRTVRLVASNEPLQLEKFQLVYEESYGDRVDHKSFGFGKLRAFLESLDVVKVTKMQVPTRKGKVSAWVLTSLSSSVGSASNEASLVAHRGFKCYDCPECGHRETKWTLAYEHIRRCCPEHVNDANLQEKCRVVQDANGTHRYGCLKCGELHYSWFQCLDHMQLCCPEVRKGTNKLFQKCRLANKKCCVPNYQRTKRLSGGSLSTTSTSSSGESASDLSWIVEETESEGATSAGQASPGTADTDGYNRQVSRLERLVAEHERTSSKPLLVTKIPEMYKAMFQGERLHARGLGFSSLEQFVESIPAFSVTISQKGRTHVAAVTLRRKSARIKRSTDKSQASPSTPKKRKAETIEEKPASKPSPESNDPIPSPKKKKAKTVEEHIFRCLECSELSVKWKTCRQHMEKCCPVRLEEPDVKEKSKVSLTHVALSPRVSPGSFS